MERESEVPDRRRSLDMDTESQGNKRALESGSPPDDSKRTKRERSSPRRSRSRSRERKDRHRRSRSRSRSRDRDSRRDRDELSRRRYREREPSPDDRMKRRRHDDDMRYDDDRGRRRYQRGEYESQHSGPQTSYYGDRRPNKRELYEGPQKTYKQFLDAQEDSLTPGEAEKKYEDYKNEWTFRQAKVFFEEHKLDEWFKERYEPGFLEKERARKIEIARKSAEEFRGLLHGSYDFNLSSSESATESNDHAAQGNDNEPEEGAVNEEGDTPKKDSHSEVSEEKPTDGDSGTNSESTEDNGGTTADSSETSETSEGTGSESQKTPEKSSTTINLKKQTSRQSDKLDAPLGSSASAPSKEPVSTIYIKVIPTYIGKEELLEVFTKSPGLKRLTLSEPSPLHNFNRRGWATYETPEQCSQALSQLNREKVKEFTLQLALNQSTFRQRITPPVASEPGRIDIDLEQSKQLCLVLDKEMQIEENPLFSADFKLDSIPNVQQLDRLITYMRRVHYVCYYCGEEYDDDENMFRRCGQKHLRGKRLENTENHPNVVTDAWASTLDSKIRTRIENPPDPQVATGKTRTEKKLEKFNTSNINKIDESRFRCGICNKLFAGDSFVRKHITLKHAEKIEEIKKEALERQFYKNYVNDPKKIVTDPRRLASHMHPHHHMHVNMPPMGNMRYGNWPGGPPMMPSMPPGPPYFQAPFFPGGGPPAHNGSAGPSGGRDNREGRGDRDGGYRGRGEGRGGRRGGRGGSRGGGRFSRGGGNQESPAGGPADPTTFQDPRGIREYVDLDAPTEDAIQIDYGTPTKK